jgi:AraC-like DNA-binding protein
VTFAQLILTGQPIVQRVELSYPAPPYYSAYEALFGCPVRFDCAATRIYCNRKVLALPLATHSLTNYAAAIDVCDRLLMQHHGGAEDVIVTIQRMLRHALPRQLAMAEVAVQLHLTERTLRRKLAERGASFSGLRHQMLMAEAYRLLRGSDLSVKAIALQLGYGDVRDFRRAFSRLTGQTPQTYRGGIEMASA